MFGSVHCFLFGFALIVEMEKKVDYAYAAEDYKDNDDPMNTRGKYNTHRPHAPTHQEENSEIEKFVVSKDEDLKPTPSRDFGPFYVTLAPFRAVLTPIGITPTPIEEKAKVGNLLLVSGHVVGYESRTGIPYACLDVWQAGIDGK